MRDKAPPAPAASAARTLGVFTQILKTFEDRERPLRDRPVLLDALGTCRSAVIHQMAKMQAGGPLYYSASTVVAAIDALALMLTGSATISLSSLIASAGPKKAGMLDYLKVRGVMFEFMNISADTAKQSEDRLRAALGKLDEALAGDLHFAFGIGFRRIPRPPRPVDVRQRSLSEAAPVIATPRDQAWLSSQGKADLGQPKRGPALRCRRSASLLIARGNECK